MQSIMMSSSRVNTVKHHRHCQDNASCVCYAIAPLRTHQRVLVTEPRTGQLRDAVIVSRYRFTALVGFGRREYAHVFLGYIRPRPRRFS